MTYIPFACRCAVKTSNKKQKVQKDRKAITQVAVKTWIETPELPVIWKNLGRMGIKDELVVIELRNNLLKAQDQIWAGANNKQVSKGIGVSDAA
jgi:hypothetical protein